MSDDLAARLASRVVSGVLAPPEFAEAREEFGVTACMRALSERARDGARAPTSGFRVGAVARGGSGALYLGANVEFPYAPLRDSVHAEQAAVHSAWIAGEGRIEALVLSAAPCGHCRQFLLELVGADALEIILPGEAARPLSELIPMAFGPRQLGREPALLAETTVALELEAEDGLMHAALEAARRSYAPYTDSPAAVAFELRDGTIVVGRTIESAAYNPTLLPLNAAVAQLSLVGREPEEVVRAVLVERDEGKVGHGTAAAVTWARLSEVGLEIAYASEG